MQSIDYDGVAALYDAYVTADLDIPFFTAKGRRAGGPVLELTAGMGGLSVPFADAGADLTCIDRSRGMLVVLARKLADRGLSAEVRCVDVCHLQSPPRFALAILPFQSFMEFVGEERQRAMLAAVFACLRPGGRFICTPHKPSVRRPQVHGALRVVGSFPFEGGSLVVSGFEQGGRPVVSRLQFFEFFGPDGRLAWKRLLPMPFELVEREALEAMAVDAGFRVGDLDGDYKWAAFDADSSPLMVWVLDRPV